MKKIIKYITGFIILLAVQFVSSQALNFANIKLPAPILGIIILALLIEFKIIKKEWIKDICNLLLSNMPLLFIPLFAGIITYFKIIKENFSAIAINVVLTTTLTLIVSALFVENVIKFIRLKKIKEAGKQ